MKVTGPRSHPGRFRRWVLRPLAWSLALLVVFLFLGQRLLDSPWARNRARELVTSRLTEALGRQVTLEDLSFSLLPLGVEIRGLEVADPEVDGEPFLRIPWAEVSADLSTLRRRHVHLREVRVERPRVSLRFTEEGSNLPDLQRSGEGGGLEIYVDHLRIDEAEVLLDHRPASFSLRARGVRSRLEGTGEARLGGRFLAEEVRLRLPETDAPLDVAAAGRVEIGRKGLEVRGVRVSHPQLDARFEGRCDWGEGEPRCSLDHAATVEAQLAEELG